MCLSYSHKSDWKNKLYFDTVLKNQNLFKQDDISRSSCQRWPANRLWAQPVYSLPTFLQVAHTRQPNQPVIHQWSLDHVTFLHDVLVTEEKKISVPERKSLLVSMGTVQQVTWTVNIMVTTHMYKYLTCFPDPHHPTGNSFILIMEQWCTCLSCHTRGRRRSRLFWQWRGTPGDASVRRDQELPVLNTVPVNPLQITGEPLGKHI